MSTAPREPASKPNYEKLTETLAVEGPPTCKEADQRVTEGGTSRLPSRRGCTMRVNYAGQPHFPNRNDLEEPLLKVLIREFGGSINFSTHGQQLEIILAKELSQNK